MKKNYFTILLCIIALQLTHAKNYVTGDVHTNLGIVSKNLTAGIESYNLAGLQYHADLCKKAIENVKTSLQDSDCTKALDLSRSISTYMDTALLADDLASGRTYLQMAEKLILDIFYEYDVCTSSETTATTDVETDKGGSALSQLEQQQAQLKQQQAALEQQANALKQQLADQKAKKAQLEKEQFIIKQNQAIANNVSSYNNLLQSCNCNTTVNDNTGSTMDATTATIPEIKSYYLEKAVKITQQYLEKLKTCKQ
ncbi:hypothetical protein [uncultured Olleya sp.]|uniref:hypothetical protein n=1 Tax=uncultured Olleya sp. TaxID=757243 RepID=UPI00048DF739|nr:hypothetical protein [uncultured Olleya sp.]